MSNERIDNKIGNTLLQIHNDIYTKINQNTIDVFLCGGGSNSKHMSTRDKIRKKMTEFKDIRILYPEDLFIEMLNRNSDYDLLSLERFLANNCDIICIVCESEGALVELGAFTNNEETVHKVVAVLDNKRRKSKSFIMLGPIKILKKINKNQVIFYTENNLDELDAQLQRTFRMKGFTESRRKKTSSNKALNTITGLYYFIPIMLYFFNKLSVDNIIKSLRFLFREKKYRLDEFDTLFKSSLKLLHKDRYISKDILKGELVYFLTEKGYKQVNDLLNSTDIYHKTILYDRIRFDIIRKQYYS